MHSGHKTVNGAYQGYFTFDMLRFYLQGLGQAHPNKIAMVKFVTMV